MKGKWLIYSMLFGILAVAGAFTTDFYVFIESMMNTQVGPVTVADLLMLGTFSGLAGVKFIEQDNRGQMAVLFTMLFFVVTHLSLVLLKETGTVFEGVLSVIGYMVLVLPVLGLELVDTLKQVF